MKKSLKAPRAQKVQKAQNLKDILTEARNAKKVNIKKAKDQNTKLRKWVNDLMQEQKEDIEDVKKYFIEHQEVTTDSDAAIVSTILKCKQGPEKIYFDTKTFNKRLKFYIVGEMLKTRLVTNDLLYLAMVMNKYLNGLEEEDPFQDYYELISVKITSNNFPVNGDVQCGIIQDYDGFYSAISGEGITRDVVVDLVERKPDRIIFTYYGEKYIGFGEPDIVFVYQDKVENVDAVNQFFKMKFLKTEQGKITLGERVIPYNEDARFFDKTIKPETFCPSYWLSPTDISVNYLFETELDYNDLFEVMKKKYKDRNGTIRFPSNLCYWDTLTNCFDFLAVFALTCPGVSKQQKNSIVELYETYIAKRNDINKIAKNQMLLQRICQDFLNCFLNDSQYIRFVNLYVKAEQYINRKKDLEDKTEVYDFLKNLPFCKLISNQLTDEVMKLGNQIYDVLGDYINGLKPTYIEEEVRKVAKKIYAYLPKYDMENAAFPFIAAPGGLIGNVDNLNFSFVNPVAEKIKKNYKKIKVEKEKNKQEIEEIASFVSQAEDIIDTFLNDYFIKKNAKTKWKDSGYEDSFINYARDAMSKNPKISDAITGAAVQYQKNKKMPSKTQETVIIELMNKFLKELENPKKKKKLSKGGVEQPRYNLRIPQKRPRAKSFDDKEEDEEDSEDEDYEDEDDEPFSFRNAGKKKSNKRKKK